MLDFYETLTPACQGGDPAAIKLVSDLYAKSSYYDYAAWEAVETQARKGQPDALDIVKLIAAKGDHEETRAAARSILGQ